MDNIDNRLTGCAVVTKAMNEEVSRIINHSIKLTTANAYQFHNMLTRKEPEKQRQYLAAVREVSLREGPFHSSSSRAKTLMLQYLPTMRLHEFSVEITPEVSWNKGSEYMLAIQHSQAYLRHLHIYIDNAPIWSLLIRKCASNLESLTLYGMDSSDEMPAFPKLKTLCYLKSWPDVETCGPIMALIEKAPELETLEALHVDADVLSMLLRQGNWKIRRLAVPGYTIRRVLQGKTGANVLANLTSLSSLGYLDNLDLHYDMLLLGSRVAKLCTLELGGANNQGLQILTQSLTDHRYFEQLRYLRLWNVDTLGESSETLNEALEGVRKICFERSIELTVVNLAR